MKLPAAVQGDAEQLRFGGHLQSQIMVFNIEVNFVPSEGLLLQIPETRETVFQIALSSAEQLHPTGFSGYALAGRLHMFVS